MFYISALYIRNIAESGVKHPKSKQSILVGVWMKKKIILTLNLIELNSTQQTQIFIALKLVHPLYLRSLFIEDIFISIFNLYTCTLQQQVT